MSTLEDRNVSLTVSLSRDGHHSIDIYWENQDESTLANLATLLYEASHKLLKQPIITHLVQRSKDDMDQYNFIFKVMAIWSLLEQSDNTRDKLVVKPTEALNLRKAIANENLS